MWLYHCFHFVKYLDEREYRTNFAYCPPNSNYGTIDAYPWTCPDRPNGKSRRKAPFFSNPDVCFEGVPTGDSQNNNAAFITKNRYKNRDKGSNCLDGKPNENWEFGNNCLERSLTSFHPPFNDSEGTHLQEFVYINIFFEIWGRFRIIHILCRKLYVLCMESLVCMHQEM